MKRPVARSAARWSLGVIAPSMVAIALVATGCSSSATTAPKRGVRAHPTIANFLSGYVDSDGRVVRRDQGGDTVSEGQAYAMLLDVATGDRRQFSLVWRWSQQHLSESDGLLASHWANGSVVDPNSASDADVDIARALVLAGSHWGEPTWTREGTTYARAILSNETVTVAGRLWLVAGPWATTAPYYLDPSYFDPGGFELLASTTHDDGWKALLSSSNVALVADTADGTRLPTDWAQVASDGQVTASAPPAGGATVYGYDAFRTLVRQSDDCEHGVGWRIDRSLQTLANKTVEARNRADTYNVNGTPAQSGNNPLMEIAAAGAAHAGGHPATVTQRLDQAEAMAHRQPSYFLDAWVELAQYLLNPSPLDACPS